MSIEQILINLPDSYKANIVAELKALSTCAIEQSEHQVAIDLLTIVKELTKPKQKESLVSPANAENTSAFNSSDSEGEFASRITDEEVVHFSNLIKSQTKVGIQYTSREINNMIEPIVLEAKNNKSLADDITLPLNPSRPERSKWKELVSRALTQLVQEGYMVRPLTNQSTNSRYLYLVVDPASQKAVPEIPQSNVIDDVADKVLDSLSNHPVQGHSAANLRSSISIPFPAFSPKPETYTATNGAVTA